MMVMAKKFGPVELTFETRKDYLYARAKGETTALEFEQQCHNELAGKCHEVKADRLMPKRDDLKTPPRGVQTPGGWKKNDEQGSPVSSAISTRQPLQSCFSVRHVLLFGIATYACGSPLSAVHARRRTAVSP